MAPRSSIDDYFTQHIVGTQTTIVLGPSARVRREHGGARLSILQGQVALVRHAAADLLSADGTAGPVGRPVSPRALARARRRLAAVALVGGLSAWSAALWAVFRHLAS